MVQCWTAIADLSPASPFRICKSEIKYRLTFAIMYTTQLYEYICIHNIRPYLPWTCNTIILFVCKMYFLSLTWVRTRDFPSRKYPKSRDENDSFRQPFPQNSKTIPTFHECFSTLLNSHYRSKKLLSWSSFLQGKKQRLITREKRIVYMWKHVWKHYTHQWPNFLFNFRSII